MQKHNLFSPLVDYVGTGQEFRAPDWYSCIKGFVKICFVLPAALLMMCVISLPVKAAELPAEALEASGDVADTAEDTDEPNLSDSSVSSGDVTAPEGYQTVISADGAVYYVSGLAEDPDASEEINYFPLYDSYEEFMESPLYVTRYENEILKKLEFYQYACAIEIALLFLLIFRKK